MKPLRIFHPVLIAVYPVLFLYSRNMDQTPFAAAFWPTAVSLLAVCGIWAILSLLFRDSLRASLTASLAAAVFFSYGHIYLALYDDFIFRHRIMIPLFLCVTAWIIVLIWRTRADLTPVNNWLNTVSILLTAFCVIQIGSYLLPGLMNGKDEVAPDASLGSPREGDPDIYYIVLDSFAGDETMRLIYGSDFSDFYEQLQKRGFYVAKNSASNYAFTFSSIPSSLNMRYLSDLTLPEKPRGPKDTRPYIRTINNSEVERFLRKRGYVCEQINSPASFGMNDFKYILLQTTLLAYWQNLEYCREVTLWIFNKLENMPASNRPRFVYAHILCPHTPFVFDETGNRPAEFTAKYRLSDTQEVKRLYVNQAQYMAKRTIELVDRLDAKSKTPPVIILQADHGPRNVTGNWPPDALNTREHMLILNAYRIPRKLITEPYPTITPVNTFRLVLNNCFDAKLPLLPDRSFYSIWDSPFSFTDVTETIRHPLTGKEKSGEVGMQETHGAD